MDEIKGFKMNIADRIRNFRLARNLTQQEMANQMKVPRETVSYMESGNSLTVENLWKAAKVLEVPVIHLLSEVKK